MVRILRAFFAGIFILFFSLKVNAQRDLIITQAGEEIRCKILDETPTRFVYAYLGPKSKILRNEIFKNLVSSFKYNYYDSDILKNEKAIVKPTKPTSPPRVDTRKKGDLEVQVANTKNSKKKEIKDEASSKQEKSINNPEKEIKNNNSSEKSEKPELKDKKENLIKDNKDNTENPTKPSSEIQNKTTEVIKTAPKDLEEVSPKKPEEKIIEKVVKSNVPSTILETETRPIIDSTKGNASTVKTEKEPDQKKESISNLEKKSIPVVPQDSKAKKPEEKPSKSKDTEDAFNQKAKAPFSEPSESSEFKNYLNYRVGIKGGLGNLMGTTEDTSPYGLYKEKLQRGYIFGADFGYFFKDNLGVGLTFTNYKTQNASNDLDYPNLFDGTNIIGGELSNNISQKFIGPSFLFRKSIDFKTFVVATVSPGMHFYNDKGLTNTAAFKFTGKSFGAAATLGLDFLIGNDIFGRDIILSLEAGYNYGQIKDLNLGPETGSKTLATPISLNRLDFAVGLRFTRFPMYLR